MAKISLLLLDIGGVLLSNAWDKVSRAAGCQRFGLDQDRYEQHHAQLVDRFERGHLTLSQYLDGTLNGIGPGLSRAEFTEFMFSESHPLEAALATARALARDRVIPMAALSNESRELNEMRIHRFQLAEIFPLFFSSCYTGLRKPEPKAFQQVLEMTRRPPEECLFVDDRADNVATATGLGIRAVQLTDPSRLGRVLQEFGIEGG